MKKVLSAILVTILILANLSFVSADPKKEYKVIAVTKVEHPKYDNVIGVKITLAEPIMYVVLKDPYGDILYCEKVKSLSFSKNFSLNVDPEDLNKQFTLELTTSEKVIKHKYVPNQLLSK
jgi:hypothetical protein